MKVEQIMTKPKFFPTPEKLQKKIDQYFENCDKNQVTEIIDGKTITKTKQIPYTIEGLCLFLGITRNTLLDYEKLDSHEDYHEIVQRAKLKVANDVMIGIHTNRYNVAAGIFNLKNNFGYKDNVEITQNTQPIVGIDYVVPDERKKIEGHSDPETK